MRYETIHNMQIPKIGFGTWKLGGREAADPSIEELSKDALRSALKLGYTHFDTAEYYAGGHAEELLGQIIREQAADRANLFVTSKVSPEHLQYADVLRCCENSLQRLNMEYLNLYLIHWPMKGMKLKETFRALNSLVRDGRVRHLGVSNFSLKLLKEAQAFSETPLLTNQVSYSLPDASCVENGVLDYCQKNEILLTAYSPVKRRNLKSDKALQMVATARGVSPQVVALAWLAQQPRVITIPMSLNPQHQADNFKAGELLLSPAELDQLR